MSVTFYVNDVEGKNVDYNFPELNLSNANACEILSVLGFEPTEMNENNFEFDLCGEISAQSFLDRVIVAQLLAPQSAYRPQFTESNLIHCSREENYVQNQLDNLETIARFALEMNTTVIFS